MSTILRTWRIFCPATNDYEIARSIYEPVNCADGSVALASLTTLLPAPDGTDVTTSATQELTNKTIKDASNTIKLNDLRVTGGAQVNIESASPAVGNILTATSATAAAWSAPPAGVPVQTDSTFEIRDDTDATIKILFDAAGGAGTTTTLTSSQTVSRVITLPDATDTLVGRATTDTLTNKTFADLVVSSIINGAATLTLPTITDTLIGRDTTDTLTNKTLTSPIIVTIVNTGTLTLPTTTDTLVGRDTTDTLTNKTLTTPIIATISNTGTLTLPTSTDTLIGRDTTDILTNKTLTFPVIATISNTGTVTLPTGTRTMVGRISTDTLSSKTIDGLTILGDTIFDELTNNLTLAVTDQTVGAPTVTIIDLGGTNGDIMISTATHVTTNKTITDASNLVEASQLTTSGTAVTTNTTAPTATDQTLATTGTTTSTWQSNNRVYNRTTVASGVYAVLVTDYVVSVTGTTGATLNLLEIGALGGNSQIMYIIKDEGGNAGTNNITINRAVADTFDDGATTSLTINTDYGVVRIAADSGTEWRSW